MCARVGNQRSRGVVTAWVGLFSKPMENNFRLDESFKEDIPQVTERENDILRQPFSEEEIKSAIFQMEHNKALDMTVFQ
jgi:hypothetical protein